MENRDAIIPRWTTSLCVRPLADLDNRLKVILIFAHKDSGPVQCAACGKLFWRAIAAHVAHRGNCENAISTRGERCPGVSVLCESCYEVLLDEKVKELGGGMQGFVFHMHDNFTYSVN